MIPNRITEAYQEMLKPKAKVLTEAGISDLVSEIKAELEKAGKEEEASRLDMVKDLVAEISMDAATMKKIMDKFLGLLADEMFLKKVSEIRTAVKAAVKLDAAQLKDVETLTQDVMKLQTDPSDRSAREMVKRHLLKVLAYITDADLKTVFGAEKKLLDLVKRNV